MPVIKIAFWQEKNHKTASDTFTLRLLPKIQMHTNMFFAIYLCYNTFDTITTNGDRLRSSFLEAI